MKKTVVVLVMILMLSGALIDAQEAELEVVSDSSSVAYIGVDDLRNRFVEFSSINLLVTGLEESWQIIVAPKVLGDYSSQLKEALEFKVDKGWHQGGITINGPPGKRINKEVHYRLDLNELGDMNKKISFQYEIVFTLVPL